MKMNAVRYAMKQKLLLTAILLVSCVTGLCAADNNDLSDKPVGQEIAQQVPGIEQAILRQEQLTNELMAVAHNKDLNATVRRQAIFTLGRLSNDKAIQFLIDNVSLRLAVPFRGDRDIANMWPCRAELWNSENWRVGQLIVSSLQTGKTDEDRIWLTSVLVQILGKDFATNCIERELNSTPVTEKAKKKNWTDVLDILKHL